MEKEPINRPFADLPAFLRTHKILLKECKEITIPTNIKDDICLLTEAMQGVKVIEKKKRIMIKPAIRHFRQTSQDNNPQKILENALQEENYRLNVTNMPEFMEGFVEDINPITIDKLRTGEFSIQKTLDLHGCSVDNANKLFQAFIKDAVREGLKCVKIIHGRGLKSKCVPVLKEHLKTWIIKAIHRKWVLAFSNALMSDGGPGATYILLKKNPAKKHIHIIG